MILTWENQSSWRKTRPLFPLYATNPTEIGLESNLGLCSAAGN